MFVVILMIGAALAMIDSRIEETKINFDENDETLYEMLNRLNVPMDEDHEEHLYFELDQPTLNRRISRCIAKGLKYLLLVMYLFIWTVPVIETFILGISMAFWGMGETRLIEYFTMLALVGIRSLSKKGRNFFRDVIYENRIFENCSYLKIWFLIESFISFGLAIAVLASPNK